MAKHNLKFINLAGSGATENLYVYEYGDDILLVDCGVGFPDPDMFGVDLVIPDFTYLRENKSKIKGLIVTHGHEDHFGAVPFLLQDIDIPVYATKLTVGFIKDKLDDYGIKKYTVETFDPEKDTLSLGVFKVTPFRVSHSVPDGVGLSIETPVGKAFHVPDYKFDWTSVDKKPFDITKAAGLASDGVLMLASDALGSTTPGFTQSEKTLEKKINRVITDASGRVFFTTISSNISRMQQAIDSAHKNGRKVCFIGRSVIRKAEIARKIGFLNYPSSIEINPHQAKRLKPSQLMYVISGCYGQPGSALYRVATNDHKHVYIEEGDTVIFSGDPAPPGSKQNVDFLVDRLFEIDVDVHYYDTQEDLHVSGHGSQEDIKLLFGLVKPKFYIPIGGTIRHMRAYAQMARDMGAKKNQVLELVSGETVNFTENSAQKGKKLHVKNVLVDGLGVGDVGNIVLRDRQVLAKDGFVIVLMQFDKSSRKISQKTEIISRGFVFEKENKKWLEAVAQKLDKVLEGKKLSTQQNVKKEAVDFLEKFFFSETGRRPMILPVVVEV